MSSDEGPGSGQSANPWAPPGGQPPVGQQQQGPPRQGQPPYAGAPVPPYPQQPYAGPPAYPPAYPPPYPGQPYPRQPYPGQPYAGPPFPARPMPGQGMPPTALPPSVPKPPSTPWWEREGLIGKILAGVGVGVTLIGVAMLLVLAARAGLLGPAVRVGGGAVLSLALLGGSFALINRPGGRIGAIALAATGTAGLYLCTISATAGYHWLTPALGLAAAAVIAAASVGLAMRWNSQALGATMTLAVGLLAPAITRDAHPNTIWFLVIVQAAGCIPEYLKTWAWLAVCRTVPVVLIVWLWLLDSGVWREHRTEAIIAGFLVGLIAVVSGLWAARRPMEAATGSMLFLGCVPMTISVHHLGRPWAAIAAGAVLAVVLLLAALRRPIGPATTSYASIGVGLVVFSAFSSLHLGQWADPGLFGVATVALLAAYQLRSKAAAIGGAIAIALGVLMYIGNDYFNGWAFPTTLGWPTLIDGVLMVVLAGLAWKVVARLAPSAFGTEVYAIMFGLPALYGLSVAVMSTAWVAGGEGALPIGRFTVTVLWMAIGAALIVASLRSQRPVVPLSAGLIVCGLAVGKLFLYDLSKLSGITRAMAFIVVGLLLLGLGAWYAQAFAKRSAARRASRQPQPAPVSGGNAPGR